jgi:peroxiredoxin
MRMLSTLAATTAALFVSAAAWAHDFGPSPGATLPAIETQDSAGGQQSFTTLAGENGLVLVFARSADWCPFCQAQLIGLEGVRSQIEARGWKLAAITTDTPEKLASFVQRRDIGYPLLSDPSSSIIGAFGLTDPNYPEGARRHGVPVPTIYFVTPDRVIAAKLGDENYRVRPAPEEVLATIDAIGN